MQRALDTVQVKVERFVIHSRQGRTLDAVQVKVERFIIHLRQGGDLLICI